MEYMEPGEMENSFVIHFSGANVDSEGLPVDELLISLDGWRQFIELAFTLHLRGTMNAKALPPEQRVRLHLKRLGPGGSIVAVLAAVGGIMGATILKHETEEAWKKIRPKVWGLVGGLYNGLLRQKQEGRSLQETAGAIEQVAKGHGVLIDDDSDPEQVTEEVGQAVSKATLILGSAVSEIYVEAPGIEEAIDVRSSDRAAISEPFRPESRVTTPDTPFQASVEFVRLNVTNGYGAIKFARPQGTDQKGVRPCRITDKVGLDRKRDPYTGSLHRREPVTLWLRRVVLNADTGSVRWDVSQHAPPPPQPELFSVSEAEQR